MNASFALTILKPKVAERAEALGIKAKSSNLYLPLGVHSNPIRLRSTPLPASGGRDSGDEEDRTPYPQDDGQPPGEAEARREVQGSAVWEQDCAPYGLVTSWSSIKKWK